MARRIRPDTSGVESLYDDVFRGGDKQNYNLYYALAWLERVSAKPIPKRCSTKTRQELTRTLQRAFHLQRQAVVDEVIARMRDADKQQKTSDWRTYEKYGTDALGNLYNGYRMVVGPQYLTFQEYIEAAVTAAYESYWKSKNRVVAMSVTGSTKTKLMLLTDYATRLGFDIDVSKNADGAPVFTVANVDLNKAPRKKTGKKP